MRLFKKKIKGPTISRAEALNRIPVKNIQITEERLETGEILIGYPVTIRPLFASLVDMLGSSVWNLLDGERSVRQLIQIFAETHQLQPREAEVAVTQFIRELGRRGLIGLG